MRPRGWLLLLLAVFCLVCSLSTGGQLYMLFFLLLIALFVLSLVSVLVARATVWSQVLLPDARAVRGEDVLMEIEVGHRCPLPIAPLLLRIQPPDPGAPLSLRVPAPWMRSVCYKQQLYCPHVGTFAVGLHSAEFSDVFSLFTFTLRPPDATRALMVRPQIGETRPLRFSPGEIENAIMARATEDTSEPADTRAWQEGDPLKRVHWKLSVRKRELLVRTFEEPMRPDALILLNCAPPPAVGEASATLRDVLCETTASLVHMQLSDGNPVRLPLMGATPRDISCDSLIQLDLALDALAQESFTGEDEFERVLLLEMRRLRRTGATALVTASINSGIADMAIQMRRSGPYLRMYYAHTTAIDEATESLLNRLEKHDIEVETIALVNDYEMEEQAG